MLWIAPAEKDSLSDALEKRLWDAADQFRANSGLKSQEYSAPVLGLIFLRFAEVRFQAQRTKLEKGRASSRRGSRIDDPAAYHAEGVLYLTPNARYDQLLALPEASDVGNIYRQVDRAHREWTPAQIGFIANIVRLYRGEAPDLTLGGEEAKAKILEVFATQPSPQPSPKGRGSAATIPPSTSGRRAGDEGGSNAVYRDVAGLCKAATLKEIEAQGWSLNPGRYVGVAAGEAVSDEDFKEQLETLNEELETVNAQARDLEQTIAGNVAEILEA
ncbi:MAG TPA: type I restriction-modification system subunit M N-terminal domain-containing protein [Opitutaceae bacterium]|nr:type I restriction-modification system subunit M N-terminal domain-containing protein [Opitutaceae bacterium]